MLQLLTRVVYMHSLAHIPIPINSLAHMPHQLPCSHAPSTPFSSQASALQSDQPRRVFPRVFYSSRYGFRTRSITHRRRTIIVGLRGGWQRHRWTIQPRPRPTAGGTTSSGRLYGTSAAVHARGQDPTCGRTGVGVQYNTTGVQRGAKRDGKSNGEWKPSTK